MDGNGWATDNVDDAIKAQQAIVNKAIAKVASHDVTSFLGNIQNMKGQRHCFRYQPLTLSLKAIGKNGDDAIAIVAELGGEFSKLNSQPSRMPLKLNKHLAPVKKHRQRMD